MNLSILFILQCWGIEGGILFLSEIGSAPIIGVHYLVEINNKLLIRESINYWRRKYNEKEETSSKECVFSSLAFVETAFLELGKWNIKLRVGPGIGIYLLKNYVKEKNTYENWIITDYYCLNSTSIGFHIEWGISSNFNQFPISTGVRTGIILLTPSEKNLFYTRGDLKEVAYLVNISF